MKHPALFIAIVLIFSFSPILSGEKPSPFHVMSSAFKEGGAIPAKYTCDGVNVSPLLRWDHIPTGTKSLALIVEDPDAPSGMFVHWVLLNMSPKRQGLPEGVKSLKDVLKESERMVQGANGTGKTGYMGPCPPSGTHRYYFRLYALDQVLPLKAGATRDHALKAMKDHVIAECALMGTYKRK